MSSGGGGGGGGVSPWSERLVNGEINNVGAAAAAATGAVSSGKGGARGGGRRRDGVIDGGSSGGGCGGCGSNRIVSSVNSRSGCSSNADSGGNSGCVSVVTVAATVIGGTGVGGASDDSFRDDEDDVTLSDARGTTLAPNRCRETTVSYIRGGGGGGGSGGGERADDDDDVADATTDRRELWPIARVNSTGTAAAATTTTTTTTATTTTTTPDAGNIDDAKTVNWGKAGSGNNTATNAAPTWLRDDDEDHRHRHKQRGNIMVAAMNEHPSSTTTSTTSSPATANGATRATNSTIATSSLSTGSSTAGAAIVSGNNNNNNNLNPSTTMMSTVMSNAAIIAANNGNGNARNVQEYREMDGDDGGKSIANATVATTTTAAAAAAAGILSFPCDFDHMYASMTDGGAPAVATATAAAAAAAALGVSPLRGNEPRQNDLTEVKHLKELLLLHLDLIQQQSEQIVTKDKLLAALRQENETLKLRLERMERRVSLQKLRSECSENSASTEHLGACSPPGVNSVNVASTSELHRNAQSETGNTLHESFKIRLNTSGGITTVKQEPHDNQNKHEVKQEASNETRFEWEEKKKRRSDPTPLSTGSKKKRGLSCSSTINTDAVSSNIQEKILCQTSPEVSRKSDRKAKSLAKKESFLTTEEHYYTAVGDPNYTLSLKQSNPVETDNSLEVPNWRVKIYTSCYTMEGTENLDDEIFNKRHLKLENDERRRKRWDVQRIREQRHIEKLKQRQERQNHQATCYNINHSGPCLSSMEEETVTSLWPDIEQIQSLQVDLHLPVTAFGSSIPSFIPSEFSLPWSNITRIKCRRPKRSTGRRKSTSRRKV